MRAAVKFCGGCNPDYDRSALWTELKQAAGDRLDWVTLDEPGWEAAVIICGCPTACPVEELNLADRPGVVVVTDNRRPAGEIIEELIKQGNDDDQNQG